MCQLMREHKVLRRGDTADTFFYQGRKIKTCFGYGEAYPSKDYMPECKNCAMWEQNWTTDLRPLLAHAL